jgi:hypothetical protein
MYPDRGTNHVSACATDLTIWVATENLHGYVQVTLTAKIFSSSQHRSTYSAVLQ